MSLREFYREFFTAIWLIRVISWLVFSLNVKVTVRRQATLSRWLNTGLMICAATPLFSRYIPHVPWLTERFLSESQWAFWAPFGALLTLGGLLFAVWARVYLGRNWSGVAALKTDHELVVRGPYVLVRHPIYSGLELAFAGTTLALGQWRGVLTVALMLIPIWHRIIVEERLKRQQFGATYDAYARRVRAFIPYLI